MTINAGTPLLLHIVAGQDGNPRVVGALSPDPRNPEAVGAWINQVESGNRALTSAARAATSPNCPVGSDAVSFDPSSLSRPVAAATGGCQISGGGRGTRN